MLAILATHPIQYQVPLWQMLARDGRIPFEVWYLSEHATRTSFDKEFQQDFAWDLEMLSGYRYRLLKTPAGATPTTFWKCRVAESLPALFRETNTKVLWVNGWQVAAYWQAVWAAHRAGVKVWLRGESNALRERPLSATARPRDRETTRQQDEGPVVSGQWSGSPSSKDSDQRSERSGPTSDFGLLTSGALRQAAKRLLLGQLFKRVDEFLCIGTANRDLYRSYGVPESKLHMAPYAVDNDRFAVQAEAIRSRRSEIRSQWGISEDAFCVLFCGKFIPKKRPFDLVEAAKLLLTDNGTRKVHLLFAGSGELGEEMRKACNVVFDAEADQRQDYVTTGHQDNKTVVSSENRRERVVSGPVVSGPQALPPASFAGFLNQTEISRAYVAADVLVLPSDYTETWGLVVNEAMASGLPCVISDRCGCAPDLGMEGANTVFLFGNASDLAAKLKQLGGHPLRSGSLKLPSLVTTVSAVATLYE